MEKLAKFCLLLALFCLFVIPSPVMSASDDIKLNLDAAVGAVNSGKRGEELWSLRFFQNSGFEWLVRELYSERNRDLEFIVNMGQMPGGRPNFFKHKRQFFELLNTISEFLPADKQHPNKSAEQHNYLQKKYGYSADAVIGVQNAIDWKYKLDAVYDQADEFAKDGVNKGRAITIYKLIAGYKDSDKKLEKLKSKGSASDSYLTVTVKDVRSFGDLNISYSGNFMAIAGRDELQVWDLKNREKVGSARLPKLLPYITTISVSKNGRFVLLGADRGGVFFGDLLENQIGQLSEKAKAGVFSPNLGFIGLIFDSNIAEKSFEIIRTKDSEVMLTMPSNAGRAGTILFSEDDKRVFVGISDFLLGYHTDTLEQFCKIRLGRKVSEYEDNSSKSDISDDLKYVALEASGVLTAVDIENNKTLKLTEFIAGNVRFMGDNLFINDRRTDMVCLIKTASMFAKESSSNRLGRSRLSTRLSRSGSKCSRSISLSKGASVSKVKELVVLDDKILIIKFQEELGNIVLTFIEAKL